MLAACISDATLAEQPVLEIDITDNDSNGLHDGPDHEAPLRTPGEDSLCNYQLDEVATQQPSLTIASVMSIHEVATYVEPSTEFEPDSWQWELPPTNPTLVMANITIDMFKDVDTVNGTVYMRVGIWQWWHDDRIARRGKPRNFPLPAKLWSPRPTISPKYQDFECYTTDFRQQESKDARIGDLITLTWYEGHICNKMDLTPFPFDIDDVEFEIRGSECVLKNGETNANCKTDYRWLLEGKDSVDRFKLGKHMAPYGWSIIATEIEYVNRSHEQDVVRIRIHMARIWSYYMYKLLFPMCMIVIINFAQVYIKVDELDGKMVHITALFLSMFTLLYAVSGDLPKTSFQTPMDWVILFTMMVLASTGVVSPICAYISGSTDHSIDVTFTLPVILANVMPNRTADEERRATANTIKTICVTGLTALYFLTVAGMFFPNYLRMRHANARIKAKAADSNLILVGVDEHVAKTKAAPCSYDMPDTLYKPWQ